MKIILFIVLLCFIDIGFANTKTDIYVCTDSNGKKDYRLERQEGCKLLQVTETKQSKQIANKRTIQPKSNEENIAPIKKDETYTGPGLSVCIDAQGRKEYLSGKYEGCRLLIAPEISEVSRKKILPSDNSLKTARAGLVLSKEGCSHTESIVYRRYDELLEKYPNISTETLRNATAKQFGISPEDLKKLHTRCTIDWVEKNPAAARDHLKKEIEGFVKDCANRGSSDPLCKAALAK